MRVPAWVTILLFLNVSLALSSASPQPEGSTSLSSLKKISRIKRQACADGTYQHEGKNCCLCAAGQKVKTHCTANQQYGECEHCEPGITYNDGPNSQETCQPCTSCSQINANLEEESPCTPARDRKCRCKSGFFCNKDGGSCKICHACTPCEYGVSKECTPTNDTECNEKSEGSDASIIGSVLGVLVVLVVAGAGGFLIWKKRKTMRREPDPAPIDDPEPSVEIPLIKAENLQPLLPDIAEELGWTDMRAVAQRSGMTQAKIDACVYDYPHNSQEQTYQLLVKYVDERGRSASKDLLQALERSGSKRKAEKIREILTRGNQDGQNSSA